jgi:predicted NBD/HSP70 family sugar kinase/DNA-binding XRE family transcriptional regulator
VAAPRIKGDQQFVKAVNRMGLLRLLREEEGISRAELAERSGLTRSTVGLLTQELIDEGWLVEADAFATGALGRRPTPLGLDGTRIVLLGAELGPDAIRVVATSIRGAVLQSAEATLESRDPDHACRQLAAMASALAAKVVRRSARLLGIGVGLHGPIDKRSGVLEFAPNIGWRGVEIGRPLAAHLDAAGLGDVPVFLQNEADLAAVGECDFRDGRVDDPLVYVSCGIGVGAGIILNESLFTGVSGSAGEIGHTTLVIDGAPCSCGRLGCAEAYIGLKSIAAAAGCLRGQKIDRKRLRARMATGDDETRASFARAGRALGVLVQNAWSTFNPQAIVLGGETVSLGGDALLDATTTVLDDFASRVGLKAPRIRLARYADLAAAVGGAAYVLHAALHPHQPALHARYVAQR